MYYRPREKKRSPLLTFILSILLVVMSMLLLVLVAIYLGYVDIEPPALADQFAPTPTPTRSPILYIADGDQYFVEGKLQQAIDAYEEAINRDPSNDIPYIRQTRLLIYTRQTAEAVERGAQAVILNPNNPENLAYYCRALDWEARYAQALEVCSCAIEMDPDFAEAYAFLSEIYADLGNWRLAQSNAEQALDTNFQSMDAHHNMGYALEVQGRYGQAVEFYENAIKLAPNLAPLYLDAGRIYHNGLADYETAEERFKQAIKLSPFDPEGYDLLGWAYYFNGDHVRAIDAFEQSIGLDSTYVNPYRRESAWGHMGTLFYTRQNFEQAVEFLPKAIELGESEFLRRARQIEIHTEVETLTGPQSIPILRGHFHQTDTLDYMAQLEPINYVSELEFETEQGCGELIKQSIQSESVLLNSSELISVTQVFSQTSGTARLEPTSNALFLDLRNLPQPQTTPFEIQVTFWPDRTDGIGFFQPDADQRAQINIQFEEKLKAPVEYYYTLGLAYTYLDRCKEAVPWLLKALEIDSSGFNPAWAGLRDCPSANSPPTPIPTPTPVPEAE